MASRLVLFDCDGTLIESHGATETAVRLAFVQNHCPPPSPLAVRALVGLSADAMIHVLCHDAPDAPEEAICASYANILRRDAAHSSSVERMVSGMRSVIADLDDGETTLGIVTGKDRDTLARTLSRFDIAGIFAICVTADDGPSKPSPELILLAIHAVDIHAARTVVVGDTVFDVLMARAAGASAVAVTWGAHSAESLELCGADAVVHRPEEIPSTVNALVPLDVPVVTLH